MRWLVVLSLPLLSPHFLLADDNDELIAKQKMKVRAFLKKIDIANPTIVETENLLVCGGYPEEKLKAAGAIVQRHYTVTLKALKFEMLDTGIKGKLAIYFFPERKQYAEFVRDAVGDRVEKDERSHTDARSTEPYVAVSVLPGFKPTDLEIEASGQAGVALLQAKAGPVVLPSWMKDGFAKAVLMRADPKAFAADRNAIRKMLYETRVKPSKYKASDVWTPGGDLEKRLVAASLMEYLVFSPELPKFVKILSGMRVDEAGNNPKFDAALTSADIKPDALDKSWKKWVQTGK